MSSFSAEGLTYPKMHALKCALNKVEGIYANFSVGCLSITVGGELIQVAKDICEEHGASFTPGYGTVQEDVLLRSSRGYKVAERVTNNARAEMKEWEI